MKVAMTTKMKNRPIATARDKIVRRAARALGKNLSDVAREIGMTPQGLFSALATSRPNNKTLKKLAEWLTQHGFTSSPADLA